MLGIRFYAAQVVGFGDSEALYACYAAHPQPAFLDHPGLVGLVARVIGEGAIPTPLRVHAITSLVATILNHTQQAPRRSPQLHAFPGKKQPDRPRPAAI